jgi:hypothetical protein
MMSESGAQQAEQQRDQEERRHHNAGRSWGRPIPPGVAGRPWLKARNRERIEAEARRLAEPLGGFDRMSALDKLYLEKAAGLLMRQARTAEDERNNTKVARALIADVEARRGQHGASGADFATLLPDGAP